MPTPSDEYINSCRFAPLTVSQEEMELAQRAETYIMSRDDAESVAKFLEKQEKMPRKLKKALSSLQDFIEDSNEMRSRFLSLQKKRLRENERRAKMKKKHLEENGLLDQKIA